MKVVALLSGGKDSCFNLLECLANGHEPVAVGGLLPTAGVGPSSFLPLASPTPRSAPNSDSSLTLVAL